MTEFDDEMMAALEADGEYLRQMTGEDHGPWGLCCHCGAMTDHPANVTCDTCFRTAVEASS